MLDAPLVRVVHRNRLDPDEGASRLFLCALESFEPTIDAFPARAHEVYEQREIVDTGVAFGEQVTFESLESADRLVEEPTDLCDMSSHRQNFRAEAVPNGTTDLSGDRRLELGRRDRERLYLAS